MSANIASDEEQRAKNHAITAREELAREEEILRLVQKQRDMKGNPYWDKQGEQGRLVQALTENADKVVKDTIKDLPQEQQVEIEKFTNKVLRGDLDKEFGIGKYAPGRTPPMDMDIEPPDLDRYYGPEE